MLGQNLLAALSPLLYQLIFVYLVGLQGRLHFGHKLLLCLLVFFLLPLPLVSCAVTLPGPIMPPVCSPAGVVPVALITPVTPVPVLIPVPSRTIPAVTPYTVVRVPPCI